MSDEADRGQVLEEAERASKIAVVRRTMGRPDNPSRRCLECREVIEEERRQALPSALRCFECEALRERERQLFAGA